MNGLFVVANLDPNAITVSITSLIGSLGAAGAAVAVTYYFLGFLRNEGDKRDRAFAELRDYNTESQQKFYDLLVRLADRQVEFLRGLQTAAYDMNDVVAENETLELKLAQATLRIEDLEAQNRELGLRWTKELPTVPGWYWMRSQEGSTGVAEVYATESGSPPGPGPDLTAKGWGRIHYFGNLYEWSGPIPCPVGQKDDLT